MQPSSHSIGASAPTSASHVLTALETALEDVWSGVCREGLEYTRPRELRSQLRRVTTEARAASISPEHLLLAIKKSWRSLPEVRRADRAEIASDLLQQFVTICIEEYYREAPRS